jgi:hypothetical protein
VHDGRAGFLRAGRPTCPQVSRPGTIRHCVAPPGRAHANHDAGNNGMAQTTRMQQHPAGRAYPQPVYGGDWHDEDAGARASGLQVMVRTAEASSSACSAPRAGLMRAGGGGDLSGLQTGGIDDCSSLLLCQPEQ